MASVEQTPVLPFSESNEGSGPERHMASLNTDMFTAVQEATFKQVQIRQHRGVSNPDNIKCIISPKSKFSQQWDLLMILLLLYTAVVTPFEVSYLSASVPPLLFMLNRLVDMAFFADIIINFCLAYELEDEGLWVVSHDRIAIRYVKGWFLIDVVSTIPFDMFVALPPSATGGESVADTLQDLKVLRVIRLFRLIKLARVLLASRLFKRWETKIALSYAVQSLIKFVIVVLTTTHWLACLLRLIVELELAFDEKGFPINYLVSNNVYESGEWGQYLIGVYWALMTITTIGYGDIELTTEGEKGVGMVAMACGGFIYAYIVGAVCGIVATMDAATAQFQQRMDALQDYMKENRIPKELRYRLREYFYHTRELQRAHHYNDLLSLMTPTLRGEVAVLSNADWVKRVPFFYPKAATDAELKSFITEVTMKLTIDSFAPEELVISKGERGLVMYIIRKGVVGCNGRIMGGGNYFGEDMILQSAVRLHDVRSLTFLDVYVLSKSDLDDVLELGNFPHIYKCVRRHVMKYAFKRNIIAFLSSITPQELRAAAGVSEKSRNTQNTNVNNYNSDDSEENASSGSESDDDNFGNTYGNSSTNAVPLMLPEGSMKGKKKLKYGKRASEKPPEIFDGLEGDGGIAAAGGRGQTNIVLRTNNVNSLAQVALNASGDDLNQRDALILQPDLLPPQLRCPICRGLSRKPTQSPTGHLFCASCISDALERAPLCPVTGEPLKTEELQDVETNNKIVWKMWGSVRVRCRFHVHGCSWTGEQSLVGNHEIKCTFKSWLSRCTYCNKVVPYTDMDKHLQTECEHYSCPKCVQREEMDRASAPSKLKNHSALVVLSKDYRYSINSPLEITQMLVFSYGKKPENVNRERLWNLLRSCYAAWKRHDQDVNAVRMVLSTALSSNWFSMKQSEDLSAWLKLMAVKSGWVHDKHPGKDKFDCPYCAEAGEWVGVTCGTCGQRWDLQDEGAILLR